MNNTDYIYLDHNATTPVDVRVLEAMLPYFTKVFGNAASLDHEAGHEANRVVNLAREQCARILNANDPKEIIFTSGATESDNIALFGVAEKYADKGDHIITCVTEHKAVLDCCRRLEQLGKRITYLPVDQFGIVDLDALRAAITPKTILISIMFANNEIGTIAPIQEIGAIAREHGVLFHTDAAQAVGHIPVDVEAMHIDLLSFSAHKIYGPKGIGGLYVRRRNPRVKVAPVIYGGGHELGIRSGTLNVPGIVGMGKALEIARVEMRAEAEKYRQWTQMMFQQLRDDLGSVELNGHPTQRLPHNLNVSIKGIESRSLIVQLKDIAISTGSACTSASVEPSHVIMALGFGEERAHNAIRMGIGRYTTLHEILTAISQISLAVQRISNL
ncbi:MAG: aminotransferase class V-fold PLP-dependent enzyme [Chloroflexi bacterium CFX4]|nr:aminotransferase class V-fold PLP-dependent enzyme [Chloroflexi bacterium CFX4]MDL1922000.1 aminotransferase class V-fold PLP-dependent enzyme [Chloroflexi bacterium CFX3]